MRAKKLDYALTVVGLLLFVAGLALIKTVQEPQGIMLALPYVCIGIGCGLLGRGVSIIIGHNIMKKHPEIEKKNRIEEQDERNIFIAGRAGEKAYKMATYVFDALLLAYALMGVDLVPILMLVAGYLFVVGYGICCRMKLEKEM